MNAFGAPSSLKPGPRKAHTDTHVQTDIRKHGPVQEVALEEAAVRVLGRRGEDQGRAVPEAEGAEEALGELHALLRLEAVRLLRGWDVG